MSDLLTHSEYKAIAKDLDLTKTAFINGKYQAGNGKTFKTINPATGNKLTEISGCNATDVDFAVQKAREAFDMVTTIIAQHTGIRTNMGKCRVYN